MSIITKSYDGFEKAIIANLKRKGGLTRNDFESTVTWQEYCQVVLDLRLAMSEWYTTAFDGNPSEDARSKFYAEYKKVLACLHDNGNKYIPVADSVEMVRYGILAAKVKTIKVDTPESIKFYDDVIKPIVREHTTAVVYNAPDVEKAAIKERLKTANDQYGELMAFDTDINSIAEITFRKQFERILGKIITKGKLKTAAERDAEQKAARQAKAKTRKALIKEIKGE